MSSSSCLTIRFCLGIFAYFSYPLWSLWTTLVSWATGSSSELTKYLNFQSLKGLSSFISQSYQVKGELESQRPEIKLIMENKSYLNINHFIILQMTDDYMLILVLHSTVKTSLDLLPWQVRKSFLLDQHFPHTITHCLFTISPHIVLRTTLNNLNHQPWFLSPTRPTWRRAD